MQATHYEEAAPTSATATEARPTLHASKLRIRCRWLRRGAISRPDDKYTK